jgi:hypothetical protein
MFNFKAVLSTTILPLDGTYSVRTLQGAEREETLSGGLVGVTHYVGHPDTKALVEVLGAVAAASKFFVGLQPGEEALCVPIKQGQSTRAIDGFTTHQAIEEISTLDVRVITRIE